MGAPPSRDNHLVVGEGRHRRASPLPTGNLRIVSWNIQFGVQIDAATSLLAQHHELRDADLVLLQEMDEDGTARIGEALGLDYVYGAPGKHAQSGRDFGNAVLSRWPIGRPEVTTLSHQAVVRGQARVLVSTHVDIGSERIFVGSVHTEVPSLGPTKRRRQFDEVVETARRWEGRRLVVGGDFNTVTGRGRRVLERKFGEIGASRVSAQAGPSLRHSGQEFTLDHVFTRGLEPLAAGVITGSDASDHRPLWVDMAIAAQ